MDAYETIEYRGFNINLYTDEDPQNPREDRDPMGTMACYHPDYHLGDRQFHKCRNSEETVQLMLEDIISPSKASALQNAWPDKFANKAISIMVKLCPIVLPLYLLDHSGLWLRTGRFQEDPGGWDTSLIGFIYLTKEKLKEEYGDDKDALERARTYLEQEVKTYGDYLSGDVSGYVVEPTDRNHSIPCEDSCWGFYDDKEYMVNEAKDNINYQIKEYRKECRAVHLKEKELDHFVNFAFAL